MIQLSDMAAFVAVVEAASFTEAAAILSTAKSVVSRRVSELEAELGAVLLDRSARQVRPTEVGAVYYAKCVRILEAVDAANSFASSFNDVIRGRLRIAVPDGLGLRLLTPLLNAFAASYPELVLDVQVGERYASAGESLFDLAALVGEPGDPNLVVRPITRLGFVLCASPGYLEHRGTPATPEDLRVHDGLMDAQSGVAGGWLLPADGDLRLFRVRERMRSNSDQQLLAAAEAGLGVVLLPRLIAAEAVAAGRLRAVLAENTPPPVEVSLGYPASRRASLKIQTLLGFLSERLQGDHALSG